MQVLFEHQQEGDRNGLGLLPGRVRAIEGAEKLPHIGWNRSETRNDLHSTGFGFALLLFRAQFYRRTGKRRRISLRFLRTAKSSRVLSFETMSGEPSSTRKKVELTDWRFLGIGCRHFARPRSATE